MDTTKRITDATIRLVLKIGYDKTTMQDIANEAGVARSTIYTKWKTKELLFADILRQESIAYLDAWYALVSQDKTNGSFMSIYRNALIAIQQNSFWLALYTQNRFVLGNFVSDEQFEQLMMERLHWNTRLLSMMQEIGFIRDNADVQTLAWVAVIFRLGLLITDMNSQSKSKRHFEIILDTFVEMFQQYIGETQEHNSEKAHTMLKAYIDDYKSNIGT
ncbi:MAG: TetR/AcrR family transcriptional regulator [Chloroflexota bacterium]